MRAIIDCNSFYCSCERLFRPDLTNSPVVVLSNNDGCIIARSDEAKVLGLTMTGPYYQQRHLLEKHKVSVFSSNYNLYGDLSMRVMETLRAIMPPKAVEVYSVDEAFLDLDHIAPGHYEAFALHLRQTVEMWTGIRVSVGVAPSKVLAKIANRLAKKEKKKTNCVMVLDDPLKMEAVLKDFEVGDLWGIGRRYAEKLRHHFAINTAWQLRDMPEEWARKHLGGIVGVRMIKELKGISCIPMKDQLDNKKMISSTRMFGKPVFSVEELKEAVATYVSRAAEKLRRQGCSAKMMDVFAVTNGKNGEKYSYDPRTDHRYVEMDHATSFTNELIRYAMPLVESLFKPGHKYVKAGVILSEIVPDQSVQGSLFKYEDRGRRRELMEAMDNLNFSMRNDVVKYVASGLKRNWKMRQEMRSGKYTTRWEELFVVT